VRCRVGLERSLATSSKNPTRHTAECARPCECGTSVQSTLGGSSGRARKFCALGLEKQRAENTARQDYLIASTLGACAASSAMSACTWCAVLACCALLSLHAEATAPVELTVNALRRALAARTTLHSL
jgi:hypothetical protein